MYLDGGVANQKIYYKSYCKQKKKQKQIKKKKKRRYKLYKEIAIDNKISPPWEANLSPTQSLDFCVCLFFYLDAVITNI